MTMAMGVFFFLLTASVGVKGSMTSVSEGGDGAHRAASVRRHRDDSWRGWNGTTAALEAHLLFALPSKRPHNGRLPYFLHLHKAGGTTVCHIARVSLKLRAPTRNCNMLGDGPRTLSDSALGYGNAAWERDCSARHDAATAARHQFTAVERWLDASYLWDRSCGSKFFFVTVMRDPVARIISHCRWERTPAETAIGWLTGGIYGAAPVQTGLAVVDNFYTRSLLGREAYFGLRSVGTAELHSAMATLARFDAVLILERLDDSLKQLYARLRWCVPPESDRRRSFGKGDESVAFSERQKAELRARNQPDVELYAFATRLALALETRLPPHNQRPCK